MNDSERDLIEEIRELELLNKLYERYVLPQMAELVQARVLTIMRTPVTPNNVYMQEYQKGEAVGLELASGLPATLLEQVQAELRVTNQENENE